MNFMRKQGLFFFTLIIAFYSIVFPIYASPAQRTSKVKDINGFWNENDIRIVTTTIVQKIGESDKIREFSKENGRKPFVVVGRIKNESSERIDTKLVAKKLQDAIIESGTIEFVADKDERPILENAENTGNTVIGADFILMGTVKSLVENGKKEQQRVYFVTIQLVDAQTHKIIFSADEKIIKIFKTSKKHY